MISGYQSALSGLQAFGKKIQANGNNIANSNTDGFKKDRVTTANVAPQGVKTYVDKVNTPGAIVLKETSGGEQFVELSNVDLASEIPDMNMNSLAYKANLKTIQVVEEMTGSLLNLKS